MVAGEINSTCLSVPVQQIHGEVIIPSCEKDAPTPLRRRGFSSRICGLGLPGARQQKTETAVYDRRQIFGAGSLASDAWAAGFRDIRSGLHGHCGAEDS